MPITEGIVPLSCLAPFPVRARRRGADE